MSHFRCFHVICVHIYLQQIDRFSQSIKVIIQQLIQDHLSNLASSATAARNVLCCNYSDFSRDAIFLTEHVVTVKTTMRDANQRITASKIAKAN